MSLTSITLTPDGRTRLRHGVLRAQETRAPTGGVRIGLLATSALLLGGDTVELEVCVGRDRELDLYDVAGTVAYDGRGRPAAWHTRVTVAPGGRLVWSGEPFVVADGADVTRTLHLDVAAEAEVVLRETLVLGRTGEWGGRLHNRTAITVADRPVLLEDQELDVTAGRTRPGMLGSYRVVDTVIGLGRPDPSGAEPPRYRLLDRRGWVARYLGAGLAESPLHAQWPHLRAR